MLLVSSIFLIPNGTFFVELVLFVIVLGTVAKFILPPIQKVLDERDRFVRGALQAGDEGQAEADRLGEEREAVLARARAEARARFEEVAQETEALRVAARARADGERDRLLARAASQIEAERSGVRAEVMADVGQLVLAAAERVLGRSVDPTRHRSILGAAAGEASTGGSR